MLMMTRRDRSTAAHISLTLHEQYPDDKRYVAYASAYRHAPSASLHPQGDSFGESPDELVSSFKLGLEISGCLRALTSISGH
jgi:hypothetical protein